MLGEARVHKGIGVRPENRNRAVFTQHCFERTCVSRFSSRRATPDPTREIFAVGGLTESDCESPSHCRRNSARADDRRPTTCASLGHPGRREPAAYGLPRDPEARRPDELLTEASSAGRLMPDDELLDLAEGISCGLPASWMPSESACCRRAGHPASGEFRRAVAGDSQSRFGQARSAKISRVGSGVRDAMKNRDDACSFEAVLRETAPVPIFWTHAIPL